MIGVLGIPVGVSNQAPAAAVLNPATLALTGWNRDYAAALPWAGTASAGSSGSKSLVTAGFGAPAAGGTSNGHGSAAFDGSLFIRDVTANVAGYISTTAYRVVIVADFLSAAAPEVNIYQDPAVLIDGSNGAWGVAVNSSYFTAYHYSGGYKTVTRPFATGKHVLDMSYDGTTLAFSVDGVAGTPVAAGTLVSLGADALLVGCSYNGANKLVADLYDVMTAQDALASVTPAQFLAYATARYGL